MPARPVASAPLQFVALLVASWLQRAQARQTEHLLAENRVLRARLGPRRFRLTDPERRLLAAKGRAVGRKLLEPAPRRGGTMSWKTFLAAHAGAIAAADFFSVEVLTRGGLVRYLVLFVIDLRSRRGSAGCCGTTTVTPHSAADA